MAQIHTTISPGGYAELQDIAVDESEADFTRATLDILFYGSEDDLRSAFPKGSASTYPGAVATGGRMIGAGVRIVRSRFGFIWASVLWIGLLAAPASLSFNGVSLQIAGATLAVRALTNIATTTELQLPVAVEGGSPVQALAPYNATGVYERSRVRMISPAWARKFSGIMIVARNAPPLQPRLIGGSRPLGLPTKFNNAVPGIGDGTAAIAISQANWFDGINTANSNGGGWLLRNFTSDAELILGEWLLYKWAADFDWIDRFSPS